MITRLRAGVELREVGRGAFLISDRVTGYALPVDEVQSEVLRHLDGARDAVSIAEEVLGDAEAAPTVVAFLEKMTRFLLVGDATGDAARLRSEQQAVLTSEMQARRDKRVAKMIDWARQRVPFHRGRLAEARGYHDLAQLPIMDKRDIRENFPAGLLPEGLDIDALVERGEASLEATSGTADDRLQVFFDHSRPGFHLSFPGVAPLPGGWGEARIAVFTTPICSGTVCHLGGMSFDERLKGELTLNSSDRVLRLTRAELDGILADWDRFRPNVLRCDPVYAAALVRAFQREKLPVPRVKVVWCSFEYCSVIHRAILEEGFGAPVVEYFGGTDIGGSEAAFRCENGRYHVWEDAYAFEFVRDGARVAEGEVGELLVTSLRNQVMPVVRYRIGDLARPLGYGCGCAHDYWYSFSLEGRIKDCLTTRDGRRLTTRDVDEQFRGLRCFDFYQLVEDAPGDYQLFVMPAPDAGSDAGEAEVTRRLLSLLGEGARLRVRSVKEIPAEKSLKYRMLVPRVATPTEPSADR
jgi:phenylacetate-CoA ligase